MWGHAAGTAPASSRPCWPPRQLACKSPASCRCRPPSPATPWRCCGRPGSRAWRGSCSSGPPRCPPGSPHPRLAQVPEHPRGPCAGRRLAAGTGSRRDLAGSVLMGLPEHGREHGVLEFAGTVGSGLSLAEVRELTALLQSVEQPVSPFTDQVPADIARRARWARPVITPKWSTLSAPRPDGSATRLARPQNRVNSSRGNGGAYGRPPGAAGFVGLMSGDG